MNAVPSYMPTRTIWLCLLGGMGAWRVLEGVRGSGASSVFFGVGLVLFGVREFLQPILFNQSAFSPARPELAIGPPVLLKTLEVVAVIAWLVGAIWSLMERSP